MNQKKLKGISGFLLLYVIFATIAGLYLIGLGSALIMIIADIFIYGSDFGLLFGVLSGLISIFIGLKAVYSVILIFLKKNKAIKHAQEFLGILSGFYGIGGIISLFSIFGMIYEKIFIQSGFMFNRQFWPSIIVFLINISLCFLLIMGFAYFEESERVRRTLDH